MSKRFLPILKNAEGDYLIWGHHNERRWWLHIGNHCLRFECGRVRGSRWLEFRHGDGYVEGVQITAGVGFGAWLTWEIPWSLRRRIPGLKGSREREWGLTHSYGRLRLLFGRDPFGSHYFSGAERSRLWCVLQNREVCLFNWHWITGRDKVERSQIMEPRRMLMPIGEWDGDEYIVEVSAELMTWRNRFRTIRRKYWNFKTPEGEKAPPIPGNPDSDFYDGDDAIYGLSTDFEHEEPVPSYRRRIIEARRHHSKEGWRPAALRGQA